MIKLVPIILLLLYGWVYYLFSARQITRMLTRKATEFNDPALGKLTARMAKIVAIPHIVVYVYENNAVNGLASPNGRIFLTRGFIEKYKAGFVSADELVSVVAHELGHIALGHLRRRGIDFALQNFLRMVVGVMISRFFPIIGPYVISGLCMMLAAKLSRKDEFEADAYASALLIKSGIGTEGQKKLLAKLESLNDGPQHSSSPVWLSSHPRAHDRIQAIEENEKRWQQKDRDDKVP